MALHRSQRHIQFVCDLLVRQIVEKCEPDDLPCQLSQLVNLVGNGHLVADVSVLGERLRRVFQGNLVTALAVVVRDPSPGDREQPRRTLPASGLKLCRLRQAEIKTVWVTSSASAAVGNERRATV